MKKYRYCFPKSSFVVFALILLSGIVAIVFASLRLAGVGKFLSAYPATDIATIVAYAFFLLLIGADLFCSYYAFEEESFLSRQLFSHKRIARDLIRKLVTDEASGLVVLYYCDFASPDTLFYLTVNLRRKDREAFIEELRLFCPDLIVESTPLPEERD